MLTVQFFALLAFFHEEIWRMLSLKNIVKTYTVGDSKVEALKGLSLSFRESEFVSVLGPSGCGKTTLLNIIGGLDRYTSGDLVIDGRSTKDYRDGDWDVYRNTSVGFVFQSYNLIPHQSILSNVELSLTLSGVPKAERRRRAADALNQVGLGGEIHKKPNQLSGGQMQRVAIARALAGDPRILLADEPTGALDSETSVQVMDLLGEIAKDRLVIMVTHNPDLADRYSTRIIRMLDGKVTDDSNPYEPEPETPSAGRSRIKKKPLRFHTALSLSLNNLMTKKGRTILTAFAGSIGIIGIALILSLSNGMQSYIDRVQEDTLSSYPLTVEDEAVDLAGMMTAMMGARTEVEEHTDDRVYPVRMMEDMLGTLSTQMATNNLEAFRNYIEDESSGIKELLNGVKYSYSTPLMIYDADTESGVSQLNPSTIYDEIGVGDMMDMGEQMGMSEMMGMHPMIGGSADAWDELIGNDELLSAQYDVVAGRMPEDYDEIVVILNDNNEVTDLTLYGLGLMDAKELGDMMKAVVAGEEYEGTDYPDSYSYDEILALRFKLLPVSMHYSETADGVWVDMSGDEAFMRDALEDATEVKVVGILRPGENVVATSNSGSIGYTSALMDELIAQTDSSPAVKAQMADRDTDIFTGIEFSTDDAPAPEFDMSTLSPEQQQMFAAMNEEERAAAMAQYAAMNTTTATYEGNLELLGVADRNKPSGISLYAKDFESKEALVDKLNDYNSRMEAEGHEENVISYTDMVGLMMSSVSTIIDAISYVLIAFVAISLVVSSIMIGIITYISVLERTKEIGILRSIGASKKDISRVFNAETLIVGFTAGLMGILVTLILCIPANAIIENLAGIKNVAVLPAVAGAILVGISMLLTFIAGLIPSRIAARKDPVEALRSE